MTTLTLGHLEDIDEWEARLKPRWYHLGGDEVVNVFCPTGPGGGVDPSCSPEGGSWKPSDLLPSHDSWKSVPADPDYVYHATNKENAADVQGGSLNPHKPWHGTEQNEWPDGSVASRSYFAKSPMTAWQFAPEHGAPVLLRVKTGKHFKTELTGDIYLEGKKVLPSRIEILTSDGWKSLTGKSTDDE